MYEQVADDFYTALLALQDMAADQSSVDEGESTISLLAESAFAFLDACRAQDETLAEQTIDRIAA